MSVTFIFLFNIFFFVICLYACFQIAAEFHRITNISLKNKFYAELDKHTPRLIAVYRQKAARTGKAAEALRSIFSAYDLLVNFMLITFIVNCLMCTSITPLSVNCLIVNCNIVLSFSGSL